MRVTSTQKGTAVEEEYLPWLRREYDKAISIKYLVKSTFGPHLMGVLSPDCGFFLFLWGLFHTEIRGEGNLTFQDARHSLLAYVRNEVRNGELTERGFARIIGISQPHAHNVLKGVRTLSPEVFDLVLKYFHLSLLDLAPLEEIELQLQHRHTPERAPEVAFLATPIGPGRPWPGTLNLRKNFPLPFPSATVPDELVMAKLTADRAMTVTLPLMTLPFWKPPRSAGLSFRPRASMSSNATARLFYGIFVRARVVTTY
jgi:hypothetical protein